MAGAKNKADAGRHEKHEGPESWAGYCGGM